MPPGNILTKECLDFGRHIARTVWLSANPYYDLSEERRGIICFSNWRCPVFGVLVVDLVIFDLDGLLADTEKWHKKAYQDVLLEMGVSLSDAYYEEHWIRAGRGIADFISGHRLSIDADEVRRGKSARYRDLVTRFVQAMPGAFELLTLLHGRKTMALATSSYSDAADVVMTSLGIRKYFAMVAANEDVSLVKPSPELFLYVACRLNQRPDNCIVLEDSEKGVLAAYAAGMRCIAVPNIHTRNHDFSKATIIIQSLKDVTIELIESLPET